jgi:hypothetical protein
MHLPKVTLLLVAAGLCGLAVIAVWQMRPAASPAVVVATSPLPLARPGQAWALVQTRLADGVAGLDLPPEGLRIEMLVQTNTNGMITATQPLPAGTKWPESVTALIKQATGSVPFALAGPAGRYRLWLVLRPSGQRPAEPVQQGQETI